MRKVAKIILPIIFAGMIGLSFTADNPTSALDENKVYICDSEGAYAYHYNKNCRGLKNCKHDILYVTKEEAIRRGKKKFCGYEQ